MSTNVSERHLRAEKKILEKVKLQINFLFLYFLWSIAGSSVPAPGLVNYDPTRPENASYRIFLPFGLYSYNFNERNNQNN